MAAPFAHLHVHTHYSLLDGANKIPDLVKRTKALGMDTLAITDHGCMFGVVEFFNECKKEGIKPILGMEAYMAPGDRRDRSGVPGETAYHLLLLAKNLEGYHNLLKLSSRAYREGFYYKPRIDKEILMEHSKGLIATSACLGGEIPSAFMKRQKMEEAVRVAETYQKIFGEDHFYIEVQNHIKEQNEVNPELAELAKKTGIGMVATNDVHFLTADDHRAHDVLCCISMGKQLSDEGRLKYPTQLYLKSPAEMQAALGNFDQAIENTVRIAAMCDVQLDFSKRYAPVYRVPKDKLRELPGWSLQRPPVADEAATPGGELRDDERYIRQLCEEGLVWRYGTTDVSPAVRQRLDYELSVIVKKNFCSYFLIVWDFCNFARDHGIPVGARGSGVGTMVGYLLGLCNVDPIAYNLLFERFMDPSRNEMPDIDIDICQDGRQKVIEYVRKKYGHVAQIITFGTLAAKAACKDVGRVLGVPLAEIDKLTKMIPGTPGMTLDRAMKEVPELSDLYRNNPTITQVIDLAKKLEGMCRNAGVHAAGVIIADQDLSSVIPMCKDKDDNLLTQFEGPIAEKCGLLKMDFLGLRTLTTLTRSIDLELHTREIRPVKWAPNQSTPPRDEKDRIDIEKIDLTDQTVFKLFQRGETRGVFQFESGGMQDLLIKMVPDRIEDLIAANALYRPGPMELIPTYCARKHGKELVPKVHPIMDAILAETYGIMCIHEDVRVSMADGTEKPIKRVRRGDVVWSLNYATSEFEAKECHGCGPTRFGDGLRITLEDGHQVTVTSDHKIYTAEGMKEAAALDPETDWVATDHSRHRHANIKSGLATARKAGLLVGAENVCEMTPHFSERLDSRPTHLAPGEHTGGCAAVKESHWRDWKSSQSQHNPRCIHRGLNGSDGDRVSAADQDVIADHRIDQSLEVGDVRYFRITKIEKVENQQFYGMSVADHHNLVGNGIVIKNCYQEQVMQVFNQLGGIDLANAYKLIKAISKKTTDVIAKFKPDFIKGTMDKGVDKEKAEEIFDLILKFGGYGFNKSHSTRYAIIAFQTAYMKTFHPVEYMSAVLTFEMGSTEKVVEYIEECRRMTLLDGSKGIRVLPPDVNISDKDFTPVYTDDPFSGGPQGRVASAKSRKKPKVEGVIRFGLAAVRGVGEKAVETIVQQRIEKGDYLNLYDFCERIDLRQVTRGTIEALVKCGAFSSTKAKRSQLLQILDRAVEMGQQIQNDLRSGQMSMFGGGPAAPSIGQTMGANLPDIEEVDNAELLKFEKELLGFYITSHPLTDQQIVIERYTTASTKEAMTMSEGIEVTVGGMIAEVKTRIAKSGRSAGQKWAIIAVEDLDGRIEGMVFSESFAAISEKYPDAMAKDSIVFVKGKIDRKREVPSLLVNEIIPVGDAVSRLTTAVAIKLDKDKHNADVIAEIPPVLARHRGNLPVYFQINTPTGKVTMQIDRQHAVKPSPAMVGDIEQLLGPGSVDLAGAGSKRKKRLEQQRLFKDDVEEVTEAPAAELSMEMDIDDSM